ncbi:MAG: hypothetical protein ACREFZ_06675 [Acetobacteraceae bacterium]
MKPRYLALFMLSFPLALAGCGSSTPASNTAAPAPATLSTPEISPPLAAMARKVRAARSGSAAAAFSSRLIRVNDQRQIQVYIYVKHLNSGIRQSIAEAGAADIRPSQALGLYQAWASPDALAKIATLRAVYKIAPPVYGFPRAGTTR